MKRVFSEWRNLLGSSNVNVIVDTRDNVAATVKSFAVDGDDTLSGVGWGFDAWGSRPWGTTAGAGMAITNNDIIQRTVINTPGRTMQVEVTTTGANDKYELLALRLEAQQLQGLIPSSWDTT